MALADHMSGRREARFRHIHTFGKLPDGRIITCHHSFPLTVGLDVLNAIDDALVTTYGNDNCRTVGTVGEPVRIEA